MHLATPWPDPSSDSLPPQASVFNGTTLVCSSLSDAIPKVLDLVVTAGRPAYVRGELNLEVLGVDVEILDPTDRLPLVTGRRLISAFCVVEFAWYCAQRTDLEPLEVYAPNISRYYGGMRSVTGSAYGRRLFGSGLGRPQWHKVIEVLRHDRGSKRAFITVFDNDESSTLLPSNLDVSCTTGFQILIRDSRLHWVTNMRANDAYRGFVSDTFSFTLLHELMASSLGFPVGNYLHRVTSLHTFPEDSTAIERILALWKMSAPPPAMKMPALRHKEFWQHLPTFWQIHDQSRLTEDWENLSKMNEMDDPWWRWVGDLLQQYHKTVSLDTE